MHKHNLRHWQHSHDFSRINRKGEKRTKIVLLLTLITMVIEIVAGIRFHTMALLADGWHMGTHVAAFMIAVFAYRYCRVHAHDQTFAFSPGKVGVLGGFASSVALAVVALIMLIESVQRILEPQPIQFDEAILVAAFGLLINLISALLLQDHHHGDAHEHGHHHDHNLKAAYLHVLADALTSVLALIALSTGKFYGWVWLDPIMGLVGAGVILIWSYSLIKETGPVLLDESIDETYRNAIRQTIEKNADNRVTDLHIWRVGPGHYAVILALVTQFPKTPEYYKKLLTDFHQLDHITVEVNQCAGQPCVPIGQ
ncbi:MAG: cation transporter [Gammaproteobacteria bacterium HGW-Gammaproteobacteria-3]|jgi:cation diffusion facilitator family transporter|nr:MAG: cation transporter [Gammaproteobacteria bacterium HGW-Gammaproteobacteria-3]